MKHFRSITVILGIAIVLSASFALRIWNYLAQIFGEEALKAAFFALFFATAVLYFFNLFYKRPPLSKIALSFLLFLLAYLLITWQPFFTEKIHVLEYGLLGFLASRDLKRAGAALCFVLLFGLLDEAFQLVLPSRVGELRDVATNVMGGLFGILLYYVRTQVR